MKIYNTTQHDPTPDQIKEGVVDLPSDIIDRIRILSTFDELPSNSELTIVAHTISLLLERFFISEQLIVHNDMSGYPYSTDAVVMIGGAPYFMGYLERALASSFIRYVYAFSKRVSIDTLVDGKTVKKSVFKHLGFVPREEEED